MYVLSVRNMLTDLADSGLVTVRPKGNRRLEYGLNKKRWLEFVTGQSFLEIKPLIWVNWISFYRALHTIWQVLNQIEGTESVYLRTSKLREAMEIIVPELIKSGLECPPAPGPEVGPNQYEKEFQDFVLKVLSISRELV